MVTWNFDSEWVMTPQQERSRQTTYRIMDAAYRLFTSRGYDETSLQDIARESEVSIGAIYTRFVDKDAIFYTIVDNYRRDTTSDFLKVFDDENWRSADAATIVCAFVDIFFVYHREYGGILNLIERRRLTNGLKIPPNSDYIAAVNARLTDLLKNRLGGASGANLAELVAIVHHVLRTTVTCTSLLEDAQASPAFHLDDAQLKSELKRMVLRYLGIPERLSDMDERLSCLELRARWCQRAADSGSPDLPAPHRGRSQSRG
jgi:AcrR family transcriptional regulator